MSKGIFQNDLRYDWAVSEIEEIYTQSLPDLIYAAQKALRVFHHADEVQASALLNIKTGGCTEDCSYCPQSIHYRTGLDPAGMISLEDTLSEAKKALEQGATRFCMGAAWREIPSGEEFENILEIIRQVNDLGLETCCTLGMLTDAQAKALAEAGLNTHNHNLDTSPEFYGNIITTRTYEERLRTIEAVRGAGISVCCGGIIGMGESRWDRYRLLEQLANQKPHPDSVPINMLVRIEGTPLQNGESLDVFEMVRMIATARILMPASMVRLSAGRMSLSDEAQALCFLAGANSIFLGERLLTTPNAEINRDHQLLERIGMRLRPISKPKHVKA